MLEFPQMSVAESLARAEELQGVVRRRAKWYSRYLAVFGCATFVSTFTVGIVPSPIGVVVSTGLWGAVVTILSIYAARQPVIRRGFAVRHVAIIAVWSVLYVVVLVLGTTHFQGELAWWLPGAMLVALPAFLGAYVEARR